MCTMIVHHVSKTTSLLVMVCYLQLFIDTHTVWCQQESTNSISFIAQVTAVSCLVSKGDAILMMTGICNCLVTTQNQHVSRLNKKYQPAIDKSDYGITLQNIHNNNVICMYLKEGVSSVQFKHDTTDTPHITWMSPAQFWRKHKCIKEYIYSTFS